jgi:hypothetical protein
MRTQLPVIRYLVLVLALVFSTGTVAADSRSEAKAHYQAGVKLYNSADYKGAIKEFSAAQDLLPADLNNYNLALCYDKLGDPEPAIQYYHAFLDKQPSSDKRAEIEASISRLENASKSAAAKKAAKDREEQAKRDAEAKKAAEDDARKAEEARKADELKQTEQSKRKPSEEDVGAGVGGSIGVGSTGTPGGSGTVSTGDSQLDRVSRINVDQIRDQRVGGSSSGMPADPRPQTPGAQPNGNASGNAAASIDVGAHANPGASTANAATPPPTSGAGAAQQPGAPDPSDKPKATPVYKKWWFWAVVAVSAYVVYSIATEDDNNNKNQARTLLPPIGNQRASTSGGGMTLFRW